MSYHTSPHLTNYLTLHHTLLYTLPYHTIPYTLPYLKPYILPYFTLHLTLPYALPYLTSYLTLHHTLPYLTFMGRWSTRANRAKIQGAAAASRCFLECLRVIHAKRNLKSSSAFIWREFFGKGPSDLWKRLQKKPFSNKFQFWNLWLYIYNY